MTRIITATGDGLGNTLDQGFGIAADGQGHVWVSGRLSDNLFAIDVSGWRDLGAGKAGSQGVPQLTGSGNLAANSANSVDLSAAHPSTTATLVLGFGLLNAKFQQGAMLPDPTFLLPVTTDATGALSVPFVMPAVVPADVDVFFQAWISDPTVTVGLGVSASNGLRGRTP
jgi:hypothetical protein